MPEMVVTPYALHASSNSRSTRPFSPPRKKSGWFMRVRGAGVQGATRRVLAHWVPQQVDMSSVQRWVTQGGAG